MRILTVNTGSSSVRIATFTGAGFAPESERRYELPVQDPVARIREVLDQVTEPVTAVGHRVVHGGRLRVTSEVAPAVESAIEVASTHAPLHNPRALEWIRACRKALGTRVPQYAVFDTTFFARLPEAASTYGLPRELARKHGIRRYGFHGLAHQSMWNRWREVATHPRPGGRIITLQLGAGASASAIRDGTPLDTSMGFSPLEGLLMATRCGDVDAGALLHLQKVEALTPETMEGVLNSQSGLLGFSGESADMRDLLASTSPDAQLAVDLYVHHARKYLGAYLMTLGGCEAVVFGGGVGENQPEVRARMLQDAEWAGIRLDQQRNDSVRGREGLISATDSTVEVWVIPPDEQSLIAAETAAAVPIRTPPPRPR